MTNQNILIARIKQLSDEEIATLLDTTSIMLKNIVLKSVLIALIADLTLLSALAISVESNVFGAKDVCVHSSQPQIQ